MQRADRRELALAQLEDTLGRRQILEPVVPEIVQHERLWLRATWSHERRRRLRDDNLAAVRGRHQPSRTMNVHPDVFRRIEPRLARVNADTDPDRAGLEALQRLRHRRDGVLRRCEGVEEGVPFVIHLIAVVP